MLGRLFCYGTLMDPHCMQQLIGRVPPSQTAQLEHYARYPLRASPWPGIIQETGKTTFGILYSELDTRDIRILDQYEGAPYRRRLVEITVQNRTTKAWAYTIATNHRRLLSHHCKRPCRSSPS